MNTISVGSPEKVNALLHDQNEWLRFYKQWRRYKLAGAAALLTILTIIGTATYAAMAGTGIVADPVAIVRHQDADPATSLNPTPEPNFIPAPEPPSAAGSILPLASPLDSPPSQTCELVYPTDGSEVGGAFQVEGDCSPLAGATIFVLVRDVYRYANLADVPQQHWIQCEVKIKDTGKFLCGLFVCVDDASYEVLVVYPRTRAALNNYSEWSKRDSQLGKSSLPFSDQVGIIGDNIVVVANHRLSPTPIACERQEPNADR